MAAVHELLVLTLVNERPTYGYDIRQFLNTSYLAHCTSISTPQVYAVLRDLQQRGLVDAKEERENNAPPRTVYSITEQGRATLFQLLRDESLVGQRILFDFDTVLSAMGHLRQLSTDKCLAVVRSRLAVVDKQLEDCQRAWDRVSASEPLPEVARAICHHRRGYLEAEQRWLQGLERDVAEKGWAWFTSAQPED